MYRTVLLRTWWNLVKETEKNKHKKQCFSSIRRVQDFSDEITWLLLAQDRQVIWWAWKHSTHNTKRLISAFDDAMQTEVMYAVTEHNLQSYLVPTIETVALWSKSDLQQECIWCRYGNMKYKKKGTWSLQVVSPNEAWRRISVTSNSSTT